MCAPRGLLGRSPWASVTPRRKIIPPAVTTHLRWRRCNSEYNFRHVKTAAMWAETDGDEGTIKHIGKGKAGAKLPRTQMNKAAERRMALSFLQLRDACHCSRCVDPQTKQRFFRTSEIPEEITPSEMMWIDRSETDARKILKLTWEQQKGEEKPHVTRLSADEIKYPAAHFHHKYVATGSKPRQHWNKLDMEKAQHWISYADYMEKDDLFLEALDKLSLYGLVFVHDIPDERDAVKRIGKRMGPLRNSFYGQTWDVRHDPQAKNVAYTSQNLDFHMDLLYMQNPPGFQLLQCLRNSCEGGESLFVDAFGAAADLDEDSWNTLSKFKVPYHYNHRHEYYRRSRPVLELPDDADLFYSASAARQLSYVNYSPPFQGPFHFRSDETGLWTYRMQRFISAMREFEKRIYDPLRTFELKLKPGQCVIFENRRVLHARRAFDMTAGERWLAGAYVDEDAVQSKHFTLKRDSGLFGWQRGG